VYNFLHGGFNADFTMVYVSNYTYVPLCVGEMKLFMVSHTLDLTPCVTFPEK